MTFGVLPAVAAWRHLGAREGFEAVFLGSGRDGHRLEGCTAAVEEGQAWAVEYEVELDRDWLTRSARVRGRSATGRRELALESDGRGRWRVDGAPAPQLDGYLDVDLESSALTNTIPVHRLGLEPGQAAEAPAVYVRATDLSVERLEQRYARVEDDDAGRVRFDYTAPRFAYAGVLLYDAAGLVLDYPDLAQRTV